MLQDQKINGIRICTLYTALYTYNSPVAFCNRVIGGSVGAGVVVVVDSQHGAAVVITGPTGNPNLGEGSSERPS